MSTYTPPPGDTISLDFGGAYTPPAGDNVALDFAGNSATDRPIAANDAYTGIPGVTMMVPAAAGVLANDTSPDSLTLTAVLDTGPVVGALSLNSDGSFGYAPPDRSERVVTYTYRARDSAARLSVAATVTLTLAWPPTQRYTHVAASLPWSKEPARLRSVLASFVHAARSRVDLALPWSKAPARQRNTVLPWRRSPRVHETTGMPWRKAGQVLRHEASLPIDLAPRHRRDASLPWSVPPSLHTHAGVPWMRPELHRREAVLPWSVPPSLRTAAGIPWTHPLRRVLRDWLPWGKAAPVRWQTGHNAPEPPVIAPPDTYRAPRGFAVAIAMACPQPHFRGFSVPVPMGPAACYFAWPRPRTYIMLNSATVTATLTGQSIEVSAIQIGESLDDTFHGFRLTLADPDDLQWLLPTSAGPIDIAINVNGWLWTGIVEHWDTQKRFPDLTRSVTGRARTALLDAPYAQPRAYVETAARTAQQLIAHELDYTGFSAAYNTVDWTVPGNVWHYDGMTPVQAVRAIAAASGAVARSHPWDKIIEILPRYPVSPWQWATAAPDKTVLDDYAPEVGDSNATSGAGGYTLQLPLWPASDGSKPGLIRPGDLVELAAAEGWKALVTATDISVTLEQSGNGASALVVWQHLTLEAPPAEPRQNYVLVSGQQVGVSAPVIRDGTAGDKRLPAIVDPLITDATVQRERGRNALAGGGDNRAISNLWLGLRDLIPSSRITIGNITADHGDGSYTIATTDGATILARAHPGQTYAITDGVMVQSGYIIDTAPSLPGTTQYV